MRRFLTKEEKIEILKDIQGGAAERGQGGGRADKGSREEQLVLPLMLR